MKWINVKNKLPSKREHVLFSNGAAVKVGVFMPLVIDKTGDFENVFMGDDQGFNMMTVHNITHWMPLPKPPNNNH